MTLRLGDELKERWRAAYAWSAEWGGPGLAVRRFRRRLYLTTVPAEFVAYVSADSRYILWVNGRRVGRGPLKGTLSHYHYEVYDLAPYLQEGENVLAAEVRWFGRHAPVSEVHSPRPGFLFQGPLLAELDTPAGWQVYVDRSVTPDTTPYIANAHQFLGYWERFDASCYPLDWLRPTAAASGWEPAVDAGPADVPGKWGESHPYQVLYPRDIPALIEIPRRFQRTWYSGQAGPHLFGEPPAGWALQAGAGGEIVLDAGGLATGYPELHFRGGAGRRVQVIYGECLLRIDDRGGYRAPVKGIRDDWAAGDVDGYRDTVILSGSELAYRPFHWRTLWFVKVVVSPGETPFYLEDVCFHETSYPQTLQASFDADLPDVSRLWATSWRTLELCAHETYEDCPYYEQLNYIADSRLQALCSLVLAGETALPRRTIRLYRDSVRPDGLVQSRVPSTVPQILPYFALLWVLMVEDYWRYVGPSERAFVRSNLHVVDGVLWFWRERLGENGFVGPLPPWSMVDNVPDWKAGEPPAVAAGESTYMTCLYIYALDAAVRLHIEAGEPGDAARWRALAQHLRLQVRRQAWSEADGLFLEGPGRAFDGFSQHSQALAILAEVATASQTRRILRRLTSDERLHQMQLMQRFYLARALEKAGGYAAFGAHVLAPWREALSRHLSTWPEYADPTRSDCHAWGSWIAADMVTCGLGVRPFKPGFEEILVAPRVEIGGWARGQAPTAAGLVSVSWRRQGERVHLVVSAPEGVPVRVKLPGVEPRLYRAGGSIVVGTLDQESTRPEP